LYSAVLLSVGWDMVMSDQEELKEFFLYQMTAMNVMSEYVTI